MDFDVVNVEKIYCNHCKKEIGRDDKFVFTHYLFNRFPLHVNNEPKCFCCVECAKLNEPLLETFICDMVLKNRKCYMYNTGTIFFTDEIEREQSRVMTLVKAFNEFVNKYNVNELYIEIDATLNKLKERQKQAMDD